MARKTSNSKARAPRKAQAPKASATPEVTTKVCPFLRAIGADVYEFPATTEFFYKDKSTKDGLAVWSKQGERIYNKGYTARKALANAEAELASTKARSKARTEAQAKVEAAREKVAEAAAMGAFKYGRVKRTHGAAREAVQS